MTQPRPDPAFRRYLDVQRAFDGELIKALEETAKDIRKRIARLDLTPGIGAQVRAAQLRMVLNAVHDEITSLWRQDVSRIVTAGRQAAAEAAERAAETISRVAYASLPADVAEALTESLRRSARAGIETNYKRIPRELSRLVYRNGSVTNGAIDRLIRRGLIQGLSARELAASVYQFVSPNTPGGASYAAMRLARTEINNAFHEQQQDTAHNPGVKGVKWNLSRSHPKPDQCNILAAQDTARLGAGVYKVDQVPSKPHPNCFCYLTYVVMTPEEFKAELLKGSFDDELRRRTRLNIDRLKESA